LQKRSRFITLPKKQHITAIKKANTEPYINKVAVHSPHHIQHTQVSLYLLINNVVGTHLKGLHLWRNRPITYITGKAITQPTNYSSDCRSEGWFL